MFTMATNLLVALATTAVAFKRWPGGTAPSAPALAGLTVYGAVVGIVYYLLLSWQHHLSGMALVANWGLHYAVPSLLALFWLFAAPKSGLKLWHPVAWLVYPLIYCIAALAHGASTGRYPYSFIDVAEFGWTGVLTHVAALAGVFVAWGWRASCWHERCRGKRGARRRPDRGICRPRQGVACSAIAIAEACHETASLHRQPVRRLLALDRYAGRRPDLRGRRRGRGRCVERAARAALLGAEGRRFRAA
jgi:hypothetical protein